MSSRSAKGSPLTAHLHTSIALLLTFLGFLGPSHRHPAACWKKEMINLEEYLFLEVCGGGKGPSQGLHLTYIFFLTGGAPKVTQQAERKHANPSQPERWQCCPAKCRGQWWPPLNFIQFPLAGPAFQRHTCQVSGCPNHNNCSLKVI